MAYDVIGILSHVGDIQQRNNFTFRDVVIIVDKSYKKETKQVPIKFQASGNRASLFDSIDFQEALKYGLQIKVFFDLNGFEWQDRSNNIVYLTNLVLISAEIINSSYNESVKGHRSGNNTVPQTARMPEPTMGSAMGMPDDLPF